MVRRLHFRQALSISVIGIYRQLRPRHIRPAQVTGCADTHVTLIIDMARLFVWH
jgi:hypothetical protein